MKKACILLSIILLSCGDDDEIKPIIDPMERSFFLNTVNGIKVHYENGRPIKLEGDDSLWEAKFEGDTRIVTRNVGTQFEDQHKYRYVDGKVADVTFMGTKIADFSYNTLGQLVKVTKDDEFLVGFKYKDNSNNYTDYVDEEGTPLGTTIEYTDVPNVLADYFLLQGPYTTYFLALPDNAIKKVIGDGLVSTYSYELNQDGLPLKITVDHDFDGEENDYAEVYEITYQ